MKRTSKLGVVSEREWLLRILTTNSRTYLGVLCKTQRMSALTILRECKYTLMRVVPPTLVPFGIRLVVFLFLFLSKEKRREQWQTRKW